MTITPTCIYCDSAELTTIIKENHINEGLTELIRVVECRKCKSISHIKTTNQLLRVGIITNKETILK